MAVPDVIQRFHSFTNNRIPVILSECKQRERESKDPDNLSLAHAVSRRSHEASQFAFESLEKARLQRLELF